MERSREDGTAVDFREKWWTENRAFSGWALRECIKNAWRFGPALDVEDFKSEMYVLFLHTCSKYRHVEEPKHLMALYKTIVRRWIITESARSSFHSWKSVDHDAFASDARRGDAAADGDGDRISVIERIGGIDHREMELVISLHSLPDDLKLLLTKLASYRGGLKRKRLKRSKVIPPRESRNEFFCRLIGAKAHERNLDEELRSALRACL